MQEKAKHQLKSFKNSLKYAGAVYTLFVLLISNCYGQSITWQRTYDGIDHVADGSNGICKADGDNFYVAGYTTFLPNHKWIYVLKLNAYGDTIWTRAISLGTSGGEGANAIVADNDGSCIITGDGSFAFSIKLDQNGNIVWNKNYGGFFKQCYFIIKTSDRGFIACGRDADCSTNCAYILKIDSLGNLQWQQTYPAVFSKHFYSIAESNDNSGYIATGFDYAGGNDTARGYILKINYTGALIWEKRYLIEQGTNIKYITRYNDSYIIAGGSYNSSLNVTRLFFGKIDELGDTSNIIIFGTNSNEYFGGFNVISDNKFVIAASKDSVDVINGHIFTFDSIGTIVSNRIYLTEDLMSLKYALPLTNGDIIFGGTVDFNTPNTSDDVYVLRTDSLLNAPPPIATNNLGNKLPVFSRLYQNFPNPFNPVTNIYYEIYKNTNIRLSIFNINGQTVSVLVNSNKSPGKYSYELSSDKLNLASGIYFIKLESDDNFMQSIKIILIK